MVAVSERIDEEIKGYFWNFIFGTKDIFGIEIGILNRIKWNGVWKVSPKENKMQPMVMCVKSKPKQILISPSPSPSPLPWRVEKTWSSLSLSAVRCGAVVANRRLSKPDRRLSKPDRRLPKPDRRLRRCVICFTDFLFCFFASPICFWIGFTSGICVNGRYFDRTIGRLSIH